MAFKNLQEEAFSAILSANLTPSATIRTPELLFGREKSLTQIKRSLNSPGRQVFIYGDRGVGKTSVALTAAYILNSAEHEPIYVVCSSESTFGEIIKSIGDTVVGVEKIMERPGSPGTYGGSILGTGANYKPPQSGDAIIPIPNNINQSLEILRYVLSKRDGEILVVIDEMERISSKKEREKFSELIKNLPELDHRIKFIFCGIGSTINELIGSHPSASRIIEPIHLEKLHHDYLWEIIINVAHKIGVSVDREKLIRISQISDGFPHYVHLIGESMFWSAFDDPDMLEIIKTKHFKAGIKGALERAEPILRLQYQKATMKTRNTEDYEEALWSVADTTSERRQVTEIYEYSYRRIMSRRNGRKALPREKFNQRLLMLKKESHGHVLIGYGSGWFGFRENIIRGYVRLRAEDDGVELGKDQR